MSKRKSFAIDAVLVWYFALMAALTIAFGARQAAFATLLGLYTGCAALSACLPWLTSSWSLPRQLLSRAALCVALIPVAFLSLAYLLRAVSPDDRSWQLLQWDRHYFSGDPVRAASRWRLPVLTELLTIAYASYYFLPMILGWVLYRKQKWQEFEHAIFAVGFGFLLSYLCYFIYPARSPYLILPELDPHQGWLSTGFHAFVVHAGLFKHEAFPSGHTGLTLVTLALAWRYERTLFWCLLPVGAGVVLATVVLGYHYLVDVVTGIAFALGFLAMDSLVLRKNQKPKAF